MLTLINAILGGVLLVAGRKLFWLFVATAGFVTGFQLTTRYFQGSEGLSIIVGLVVGAIFAILAIFLQTIAIGIAGFLAGGYILQTLIAMLGFEIAASTWVIFIIGGMIGVLLVSFLFDWAIITLSSLAGATLIMQAFNLQNSQLIFIILFLAGVIIQGTTLRSEVRHEHIHDHLDD